MMVKHPGMKQNQYLTITAELHEYADADAAFHTSPWQRQQLG
jgi:hypothetical protein